MSIYEQSLRYLGWRGQALEPELERDLQAVIIECERLAQPRFVWRSFSFSCKEDEIKLANTAFAFNSRSLVGLLKNASEAALMAVTLGQRLEIELQRLGQSNVSHAVMLDAVASAMVESVCDDAEREIGRYAEQNKLTPLPRFSPGYGDWELSSQPMLLSILNANRRIGLSCTSSNLLLPQKSVTALVGLLPESAVANISISSSCKGCVGAEKCGYSSCILLNNEV